MKQSNHFDFKKRESRKGYYIYPPDCIEGVALPWTSEVVSADGAHYHCWIKKSWSRTH